MASVILRFPEEQVATFVCSFGAADAANYDLVGTKGRLTLHNGYEYAAPVEMQVTVGEKKAVRHFKMRDQFAPELLYFSDCILRNKEPEPSGLEGLADVRVIEAIYKSAKTRKAVKLPAMSKQNRPSSRQEIRRAAVKKPDLVHVQSGSS
jgi:glucose-fructose oxidoreductase